MSDYEEWEPNEESFSRKVKGG
jgi:hypothetical protein